MISERICLLASIPATAPRVRKTQQHVFCQGVAIGTFSVGGSKSVLWRASGTGFSLALRLRSAVLAIAAWCAAFAAMACARITTSLHASRSFFSLSRSKNKAKMAQAPYLVDHKRGEVNELRMLLSNPKVIRMTLLNSRLASQWSLLYSLWNPRLTMMYCIRSPESRDMYHPSRFLRVQCLHFSQRFPLC